MIPPISIDGTDITGATIDGIEVDEITVDGTPVFTAGPDAVFAGSFDDKLYALDISDGSEIWSFNTGGSVQSGIAVDDSAVYAGSDDDKVYALDITDGSELWSFTAGDAINGITV